MRKVLARWNARGERGSAVLTVLTLTAVIAALLMANAAVVHQLRQELQRIDRQHQQRLAAPGGGQ